MLFTSPFFVIFFAFVFSVYWLLPQNRQRKQFLLLASLFFYGCWDYRFTAMLLGISYADYWLGRLIEDTADSTRRRRYMWCSLAMNLGVLAFFKYCNFFISSAIDLAALAGVHLSQPMLQIILPVGVSFITFQSLSYIIDVYRGEVKAVRDPLDYLLSASFFPQLVAGPIMRPAYFLPQLADKRHLDAGQIRAMLLLFLLGFFKKTCLADNIAPYVDMVFAHPSAYSLQASTTAVWLYAMQIYCDFSGYTDMAIAVAGLLGFKLVTNFNRPYLSTSIQDFWRRWHMSLSFWIRDYIYISLGGRSTQRWVTYKNLMLTMLAGGLWHGAAWTFVVWGGLHGAGLVVNRDFKHRFGDVLKGRVGQALGWFLTINFVCLVWIFFRATDFHTAWLLVQRYLFLHDGGAQTYPLALMLVPVAALLVEWGGHRLHLMQKIAQLSPYLYAVLYGVLWAVALALLPLNSAPFIYFQF